MRVTWRADPPGALYARRTPRAAPRPGPTRENAFWAGLRALRASTPLNSERLREMRSGSTTQRRPGMIDDVRGFLFPSLTTLLAALTLLSGITFSTEIHASAHARVSKTALGVSADFRM